MSTVSRLYQQDKRDSVTAWSHEAEKGTTDPADDGNQLEHPTGMFLAMSAFPKMLR